MYSHGLRSVHEFPCAWQVVIRLPWLPLQLGVPGSEVSQARGSARGLSRYSGTVRFFSSSWTLSLSGRVAVRLRERRQWDSDFTLIVGGTDASRRTGPQLVLFPVPHFRELRPESLKVTGMGLRGVTCRCGGLVWWFGWSPQFLFGLVERQLDLSFVAARLRGRPVRESRRLPNRLLVPGRIVVEHGLRHHQQCNFLSLYTSGYAPGSVVHVYGFS
ncbi:hypothetical protein Taro_001490 [Colocasia esculenta]|uniref:Uncharacterized protein n=1 Tax=Colocasia esculenta TaxID=4460 RepID=A0A843TGC9_COLES|nr:hypothetical protein [Colocasia esculenta]